MIAALMALLVSLANASPDCRSAFQSVEEVMVQKGIRFEDRFGAVVVLPVPEGHKLNRLAFRIEKTFRMRLVLLTSATYRNAELLNSDRNMVIYLPDHLIAFSEFMDMSDLMQEVWKSYRSILRIRHRQNWTDDEVD